MTELVTARDPEVQGLLDKQAIREVMMRYCRGLDRCDATLLASAYHPDAVDDHGGRTFSGAGLGQGIIDWMREMHIVMGTHHITNQAIHLDGDTAGSESYFSGFMLESHDGEERTLQMAGRYLDRLERRNGEWKIAHRVVVPEMAGHLPAGLTWLGRRLGYDGSDTTDPSYAVLG